jgi:hypothetical protein
LRRLETEFATEIFPDTFYTRDHSISHLTLSYLLRSYVMLQKSHIPEEMIARLLVHPFAEENISRGKLDGRVRGSCAGLQQVYDDILEFVTNKFGAILRLPVCQGERTVSVDLLGNAIWKPLYEAFLSKHPVIFKSSDADRFHHNYTISMKFLDALESLCGSESMKQRFRSHEAVVEFQEQWNMDVYFQLRYNELSSTVDKAFGVKREENKDDSAETPRSSSPWDESVFLPPLLPDFVKLTLQLWTHYVTVWQEPLGQAVALLRASSKPNFSGVQFTCLTSDEDILCAGNDFSILHSKVGLFITTGYHPCSTG